MVVTIHFVGFHPTLIYGGFEKIRVEYPIERVYLLYDGKQDRYGAVSRYNVKRLANVLSFFKPILIAVNPLIPRNVFSKIYAILKIEREEGKEVLLDVTDMPPIAASVASVAAAMLENVVIYSVLSEQRGEFIPDPSTPDFEGWIEKKDSNVAKDVIEIPLTSMSRREFDEQKDIEKKILTVLYERNGSADSIKTLIEWCSCDSHNPVIKAQFSRAIADLEERGLVKRIYKGKRRGVSLTETGMALIEAERLIPEIKKRITDAFSRPASLLITEHTL